MKLEKLQKTFDGVLAENKVHRYGNAILALALLIAVMGMMAKDEVVVLQPPTLTEEAEIGPNWASDTYKKSWGLYLATLMGNVTPGNADIVKKALDPLLSAAIYQQTIDLIDTQIAQIRRDRVTLSFEPQSVSYETETGKVFVTGYSKIVGPTGNENRDKRTYEYEINVTNYRPVLDYLDTYGGDAKTTDVVEKEEVREQRRLEKERERAGE